MSSSIAVKSATRCSARAARVQISASFDAQLPELTARTAQTARFDRTQYAGLEHARSGRSIREGERRSGVHVFRALAQSMIHNVAPAMVTEVFAPAEGAVAISRGISVWFVQECNGQEGDGTMVWCKEDPQVRRSS